MYIISVSSPWALFGGSVVGGEIIDVNGCTIWADVVDFEQGLKMRLSLDEWHHLGLAERHPIRVGRDGSPDKHLFVAHVTERPPVVLVVLECRSVAAG